MYRQLYQLGGIGTLPMDYGQPLQIPQQQQSMFTTTGSATSNDLLNYGQTELRKAGGTPFSRPGYQEGGITDFYKAEEPIIPRIENIGGLLDQAEKSIGQPINNFTSPLATTFSRFGMQEGGMGMVQDQMQPQQMDARQALELIIQMLIAQGIPPEQAREIAIQMVQAVAEGGMEEMSDERVEARFGGRIGYASGGIGSLVDRQGYFVGKIAKAVTGAVKGVANAVKSVVKSPIGKLALTAAALYAAPYAFGATTGGLTGYAQAFPGLAPTIASGQEFFLGPITEGGTRGIGFLDKINPFSSGFNLLNAAKDVGISSLIPSTDTLKTFGLGTLAGKFLGGGAPKREDFGSDEEYEQAVAQWKTTLQSRLDQPNPQFTQGLYPNNPFYPQRAAQGGRIGYQMGGIGDLISQVTKEEFFGRPAMAMGGEIPIRENQAGVQELDYRQTGGFVPPIGIKERADDIPAMLSNNEFVFTADAVRNAGGGNVNKGAERMYSLMKNLEAGGRV